MCCHLVLFEELLCTSSFFLLTVKGRVSLFFKLSFYLTMMEYSFLSLYRGFKHGFYKNLFFPHPFGRKYAIIFVFLFPNDFLCLLVHFY